MRGGSEYAGPKGLDRVVELAVEPAVAVVEQESICEINADYVAQLLQRPVGAGLDGDVAVDETIPVLDYDGQAQDAEAGRDGDAGITGEDSLGVQSQEGRPPEIPWG